MDEAKWAITEQLGFQAQFNCKVKEHLTKFVVHHFTNKCVILITQYGGLPNLYMVQFDANDGHDERMSALNISELHTSVPVTIKCLLGVDKMEIRAGIQFLINRTKLSQCKTDIVITLGLRETSGDVLKEIADILHRKAL